MNVSIIGAGYVGLVSGACFAEKGHRVVCVDTDQHKVNAIRQSRAPFHEPGLDDLLRRHAGNALTATTDLAAAVRDSTLTLIAVGTPFDGKRIDLSAVTAASEQIGRALRDKRGRHTIVVKSTVVPGTTTSLVGPALERASGRTLGPDLGLGMNPEFLTEGEAVTDFMEPDRIVIGGIDDASIADQDALYAAFRGVPTIRTTPATAEMIKYASNAVLATLISFSNELGNLCDTVGGVDIADVMRGVHASRYLTPLRSGERASPAPITSFLWAGCGFGGSCLPKDVAALRAHGEAAGQPMPVLDAVLRVNAAQPARMTRLLRKHFPDLRAVRVAVLGLAFRPDTDDVRHTPAFPIIRELAAAGADLRAWDPKAIPTARDALRDVPVDYRASLEDALRDAQAALIITRWAEFRRVPDIIRGRRPPVVVIDGRRVIDPASAEVYEGIGRSAPTTGA